MVLFDAPLLVSVCLLLLRVLEGKANLLFRFLKRSECNISKSPRLNLHWQQGR